ncbi:MAG: alpha/beta fold hydrolase [Bdellovibrionota bacterium]
MSEVTVERHQFEIRGAEGRPIGGTLFCRSNVTAKAPVVVICHGFKAFQNWGFFPSLGAYFAGLGYVAITFEFSHNGIGDDPLLTSELSVFQQNRFSFEREDVHAVVSAIQSRQVPISSGDPDRIFLLGHSRGGAAAISAGGLSGIVGLALLASISDYPTVTETEAEQWRNEGVWYVENARTKQQLPLGIPLLNELLHERGTIERQAQRLDVPVCIVHGTQDSTVPVGSAESLAAWIKRAELHLLQTDHTFGARHPYVEPSPSLEEVKAIVSSFFERCLSELAA